MNTADFEGTLVLERLSEIGKVVDFLDAVDADDFKHAAALMRSADLDAKTIAWVLAKMAAADGDH